MCSKKVSLRTQNLDPYLEKYCRSVHTEAPSCEVMSNSPNNIKTKWTLWSIYRFSSISFLNSEYSSVALYASVGGLKTFSAIRWKQSSKTVSSQGYCPFGVHSSLQTATSSGSTLWSLSSAAWSLGLGISGMKPIRYVSRYTGYDSIQKQYIFKAERFDTIRYSLKTIRFNTVWKQYDS